MATISSWCTITKKSTSGGKGNTPRTKVELSTPVPSACTLNVHVSESEVQLCPPALMVNVIAHWSLRSKVSKPTKAKGVVGAGASVDGGNVPVAENAHVPRILSLVKSDCARTGGMRLHAPTTLRTIKGIRSGSEDATLAISSA